MYCPNCGQQQPENTKFCNNCGTALQAPSPASEPMNQAQVQQPVPQPVQPVQQQIPKQRKAWYKRWWIWVIIGIASTMLISAIGNAFGKKTSSPNPNSSVSMKKPAATTKEVPPISSAEDEVQYYTVGESYEAKGLKTTVNSCEEYTEDNKYLQPKDGNIYIKVNITIENISNTDKSVGTGLFDCYVNNAVAKQDWIVGDDDLTLYDSISPGRAVTGSLYYEIPKDAESIELEFSPSYWSTNKRIVYKLK